MFGAARAVSAHRPGQPASVPSAEGPGHRSSFVRGHRGAGLPFLSLGYSSSPRPAPPQGPLSFPAFGELGLTRQSLGLAASHDLHSGQVPHLRSSPTP